jgi:phosphoglycolate phosphatase
MRYRLVLFDFDGTLADTFLPTVQIFNQLAEKHGFLPIADPEDFRRMDLMALARAQAVPILKVPALMREYRLLQRAAGTVPRLFPGLAEGLREIRQAGCRMGVISSSAKEPIMDCLSTGGVADLFEVVVGYSRLMGKARGIRSVLKNLRLTSRDAVYVGDEVRDIEAARGAGIDIAVVPWGFNLPQLLQSHRPTYLVTSPLELVRTVTA